MRRPLTPPPPPLSPPSQLLAHGADVGRVSALPDATTALHLASGAPAVPGREVVVDMLLRAGANAFVENGRGATVGVKDAA